MLHRHASPPHTYPDSTQKPRRLHERRRMTPAPRHAAPTVLVVDADALICGLVTAGLESHDVRAYAAHSGGEAVRALRAHPEIGAALIDGWMPWAGGAAVARALRRARPGLPCCLMGGLPDDEDDSWPGAGGWSKVIPRPLDAARSARAVRKLLGE